MTRVCLIYNPESSKSMVANKPNWAHEVIRLREAFHPMVAEPQPTTKEKLETAINIAQLFGPRWRLPIAANLIGMLPHQNDDKAILQVFTATPFTGLVALFLLAFNKLINKVEERENCSPSKTKVMAFITLPEVQQFSEVMRSIHKYTCLATMKSRLSITDQIYLQSKY